MSGAANGHDTSHPFLTARHVDDLKGAVQSLTRMQSQQVEATKAQTLALVTAAQAVALLTEQITRLTDTLTAGPIAADTPGGRKKPKEK